MGFPCTTSELTGESSEILSRGKISSWSDLFFLKLHHFSPMKCFANRFFRSRVCQDYKWSLQQIDKHTLTSIWKSNFQKAVIALSAHLELLMRTFLNAPTKIVTSRIFVRDWRNPSSCRFEDSEQTDLCFQKY